MIVGVRKPSRKRVLQISASGINSFHSSHYSQPPRTQEPNALVPLWLVYGDIRVAVRKEIDCVLLGGLSPLRCALELRTRISKRLCGRFCAGYTNQAVHAHLVDLEHYDNL
jgi:hypothetical protein